MSKNKIEGNSLYKVHECKIYLEHESVVFLFTPMFSFSIPSIYSNVKSKGILFYSMLLVTIKCQENEHYQFTRLEN